MSDPITAALHRSGFLTLLQRLCSWLSSSCSDLVFSHWRWRVTWRIKLYYLSSRHGCGQREQHPELSVQLQAASFSGRLWCVCSDQDWSHVWTTQDVSNQFKLLIDSTLHSFFILWSHFLCLESASSTSKRFIYTFIFNQEATGKNMTFLKACVCVLLSVVQQRTARLLAAFLPLWTSYSQLQERWVTQAHFSGVGRFHSVFHGTS